MQKKGLTGQEKKEKMEKGKTMRRLGTGVKSAIRILAFFLVLAAVLGGLNRIVRLKYGDGIYDVTKFYELEKGTVDVLVLGSSRAFEDINTGTLWDEHGIAAYVLGGSEQPMWNTYYYLKEALKTQTPELIVLEAYNAAFNDDYSDDSRIIKNNFGLKWSMDKVNSLKVSAPRERWSEFFLEYTQYHTRYRELSKEDFLKNQGYRLYDDWKGFGCNMDTTPLESADVRHITERAALREKSETYYRAVIELAQKRQIPIMVMISPYAGISEEKQKQLNTIGDIAAEYQVPFINCNLILDEIGIDFALDAADYAHLNYRGNTKLTHYIGAFIKENFEVSCRTGDVRYATWQRNADYIRQMIWDQMLLESSDLESIIPLIQVPNYTVMLSVDGGCSTSDEDLASFFAACGIPGTGESGIWLRENGQVSWYSGTGEAGRMITTPAYEFCMMRIPNEFGQYVNILMQNNVQCKKVDNGVNVLVYDTKTEEIADTFGIDTDNGYGIVR